MERRTKEKNSRDRGRESEGGRGGREEGNNLSLNIH